MSGERLWQSDAMNEQDRFGTAYFVRQADRHFVTNDSGELIIAQFTPEGYHEYDRTPLLEPTLRTRGGASGRWNDRTVLWAHPAFANQHVVAREWEDTIVFMHEVHAGRSDRSYGIQVARLAGIPQSTVDRAKQILEGLEGDELSRGGRTSFRDTGAIQDRQIGLFQQPRQERSAIAKQIDAIDVDSMTPLAALTLLSELKKNIDE